MDIGKQIATIMKLTPCQVCSELYRGTFLKAGLLSMSFRHSKGNWRHRSSTAININKFSCCNTSQSVKPTHLEGPSDLNSRAVFFVCLFVCLLFFFDIVNFFFFPLAGYRDIIHHIVPPGTCSTWPHPKPSRSWILQSTTSLNFLAIIIYVSSEILRYT